MHFVLLFIFIVTSNIHISKSDEENNCVYRNLYGCKDYNYTFIETLTKTTSGVLNFIKKGDDLLAQETKDRTPKNNEEYDFIIVGAGSAGCTVAARLTELDNVTVLLIEAGVEENLLFDIPLSLHYLQFSNVINWHYETEPSSTYCLGDTDRRCKWPRGRAMGGTSVMGYMVATRGHPLDYDGWAAMGNTGWSYNDTLKYFKKLEQIHIPELREDRKLHNTDGPLPISYPPFRTPIGKAFIEAEAEMGYSMIDVNGEKRIGYSYTPYTAKNGERMSVNRAYLYPNSRRKNLFVSKNSHVNKVLIDPQTKKAYGVEFSKSIKLKQKTIRVKAKKEIILCAGAIGSPQILMLSGVGPRDHLKDTKVDVIQDAPVGKNLMDHLIYPALVFLIDQPVSILSRKLLNPLEPYIIDYLTKRAGPYTIPGGSEAIAFFDTDEPNNLEAYPNIEFCFTSGSVLNDPLFRYVTGISNNSYWESTFANLSGKYSWSIFPVVMRPRSRGEILLKDKHPKSKPKLIPNYYSDPEDVKVMIKGIRAAIEVSKTKAMQRFKSQVVEAEIPGCEVHKYDSDDYWECAIRSFTKTLFHVSGTCKMAPENDTSGVVNPRLQVKGIKGLRVADASIMPSMITGHLMIPTIMIAEKLSDMVKEDWSYISAT